MFSLPAQSRRWELGHLLVVGAALLSVGAAAIHFAVDPEHFREYWGFGVFFVVVAWLQLAFAAAALVRGQRAIVVGAAIGNALVVVIWIVSRTIGIPLGPESGTAESATVIDLMATAFELVIVVCCIGSLASRIRGRQLTRSVLTRLVIVAVAVVIALTTWAVAAPTREGTTHGHDSDAEHGRNTGQVLNPRARGGIDQLARAGVIEQEAALAQFRPSIPPRKHVVLVVVGLVHPWSSGLRSPSRSGSSLSSPPSPCGAIVQRARSTASSRSSPRWSSWPWSVSCGQSGEWGACISLYGSPTYTNFWAASGVTDDEGATSNRWFGARDACMQ
jgi:hypothetical protein